MIRGKEFRELSKKIDISITLFATDTMIANLECEIELKYTEKEKRRLIIASCTVTIKRNGVGCSLAKAHLQLIFKLHIP